MDLYIKTAEKLIPVYSILCWTFKALNLYTEAGSNAQQSEAVFISLWAYQWSLVQKYLVHQM